MRKTISAISKKLFISPVSKICIIFFGIAFLSLGAFANPHLASKQQIGMFKNSKTCVVLENGVGTYNVYIKDAVQKFWKSTEYEFIDQQEFEKRRHDSKYSNYRMVTNDNEDGFNLNDFNHIN